MLPRETAQRLGIAKPTLRKWAMEFSPWLSAGAFAPGKGHERRYSTDDIAVLQRVQRMLGDRYTYDEIKQRLGAPEATNDYSEDAISSKKHDSINAIDHTQITVLDERPELALLRQMLEAQRETIEAQQTVVSSQNQIIDQQRSQLDALEKGLNAAYADQKRILEKIPRWLRIILRV